MPFPLISMGDLLQYMRLVLIPAILVALGLRVVSLV